jgi:hypothetical protein
VSPVGIFHQRMVIEDITGVLVDIATNLVGFNEHN